MPLKAALDRPAAGSVRPTATTTTRNRSGRRMAFAKALKKSRRDPETRRNRLTSTRLATSASPATRISTSAEASGAGAQDSQLRTISISCRKSFLIPGRVSAAQIGAPHVDLARAALYLTAPGAMAA